MLSSRLACIIACTWLGTVSVFGNGGAWPTGVPSTGNAAPSDETRSTNVVIEEKQLTIDLQFAAVEVRCRMRNAGPRRNAR